MNLLQTFEGLPAGSIISIAGVGYLRYEDRDAAGVGNVFSVPDQIAALTGPAVQQAAQTYLNTENYVRVTLMPETK